MTVDERLLLDQSRAAGASGGGELARARELPRRQAVWIALGAIMLLGAAFRLYNIEWDDNHILHPDERFVISTAVAIQWPSSVGEYFDSATSPLNPYNLENGSYIYGTFPLFLQKLLATLMGRDSYDQFALPARMASALFDLATVLLVFLIGQRLFGPRTGLLAALLLSMAVLPIQLSRFGTSDTFMSALCLAAFYLILRADGGGSWKAYLLAGIAAGCAIASKLSAAPVLLLLLVPLGEQLRLHGWRAAMGRRPGHQLRPAIGVALALIAAVWAFRIGQPYSFAGPSILDFSFDERWLRNVEEQGNISSGRGQVPYTVQWADRTPVLFMLGQLVRWGLGPPLGITAVIALTAAGASLALRRAWPPAWQIALVAWPTFTIVYYGTGLMQYLRYALPAYPFLALLAAALLVTLWNLGRRSEKRFTRLAYRAPAVVVSVLTLAYALAFIGIYTRPITRIEASAWMYENLPPGSSLTYEEWDDALPLRLPGHEHTFELLPTAPYHEESPEKIETFIATLARADYVVLSSNRVYRSVPRIPEQYPMITRYYELLFSGELGFDLIKTFTSRPRLLGIELNDDGAEESFTVYDHPKVRIFQKTERFDPAFIRGELTAALNSVPAVVQVGPLGTGYNFLLLNEEERIAQQAGGTWSEIFDRDGMTNRHPVRTWYLALQLMALAAIPACWRLLRALPDRGYAVAKTIGLFGVGYIAWLLASLRIVDFGRTAVLIGIGAVAALSVALVWRQRRAFVVDMRSRWREVLIAEALFVSAFFAFVWLRSLNPDLWHPFRGGEKPMEFAYFNAVIRSTHFPPYDPWFAGGYINYYYLGYAVLGAVVRLTGVVPAVAFNLAVPALFALLALNAWSFVVNALRLMVARWRTARPLPALLFGLLGPLFVAVLGNVDLAARVGRGELGYGAPAAASAFGLGAAGDVVRGVWRMVTDYRPLVPDAYWPSTRIIPETVNEFPYFTFLFADLHPHMMSLAVTSGVLIVALAILSARRWPPARPEPPGAGPLFTRPAGLRDAFESARGAPARERLGLVALAAFVTGTLFPLNAWDFPTFVIVVAGAFALLELLSPAADGEPGRWTVTYPAVRRVVIWTGATVVLGRVLYLPFFARYQQPNTGFEPWEGYKTLPGEYLTIHAIPLFFVLSFLLTELARAARAWQLPFIEPGRFAWRTAPQPDGGRAVGISFTIASRALAVSPLAVVAGLLVSGVVLAFSAGSLPLLLLALAIPVSAVAWYRRHEPVTLALAALAGLALALSLAVELYALRGDIGRFNTVFKFYLQIWLFYGVIAAVGLAMLVARDRTLLAPPGRVSWGIVAALLLLAGAAYPVFATPARLDNRFTELPRTLDGLAYMQYATYSDDPFNDGRVQTYSLGADRAAIDWLLDNVQGSPVILEATTPLYRWGSRISVNTGLPTVIGWDWHQTQQRPGYGRLIEQRKRDVQRIYGDVVAFNDIRPLLDRYHVRYIYVGELERAYYPAEGLRKFELAAAAGDLTIVYRSPAVTIYKYAGAPAS